MYELNNKQINKFFSSIIFRADLDFVYIAV